MSSMLINLLRFALYMYTLPSLFIQILIVRLLILQRKKHPFKNAFFRIFLLLSIVNCIQFVLMQLTVRLPSMGLALQFYLSLSELLCTMASFISWHLILITHIANALICVNRFTAVYSPTRYKNIWNDRVLFMVCALTLLIPITYSYRWLFHGTRFFRYEDGATLKFVINNGSQQMEKLRHSTIMFFCFALFDLIVNVASISLYRRTRKTTHFSHIERNLFIATLWMFSITLLFAIFLMCYQLAFFGNLQSLQPFLQASSAFIVDGYMLSDTWILIFVSRDVRAELSQTLFGKSANDADQVSIRSKQATRTQRSPLLTKQIT
ncbi:hypothetical protein Tcan_16951 [Toxocara canis]|uniref:Serpentine receptor class gamma n=1 Tax=Toxocara canis TaxID=6265 RepID=A0A0B2VKA3_TOXCA|nr:hypothetical protein Tcan_16951 [Toxocara canis]